MVIVKKYLLGAYMLAFVAFNAFAVNVVPPPNIDSPKTEGLERVLYTDVGPSGRVIEIESVDDTIKLRGLIHLGLSIILFVLSFFLLNGAMKIYNEYYSKRAPQFIFLLLPLSLLFVILWTILICDGKDIPRGFFVSEIVIFPNQFVLGFIIPNILASSIAMHNYSVIAFMDNIEESYKIRKDNKFALVGLIFTIITLALNIFILILVYK